MTARARSPKRRRRIARSALLALLGLAAFAAPAHAQVSASIGVESDYRVRGYSVSAERPIASATVSYDAPSGFYASLSADEVFSRDGPRFLGLDGSVGYATWIAPALSLDAGVHRVDYRAPDPVARDTRYTEAYVGLGTHGIAAHVFYSPDYLTANASTLYGEVDGGVEPAPGWRLDAHVGTLVYLDTGTGLYRGLPISDAQRYDWRIGVSRRLGKLDLHAALSGSGPGDERYDEHYRPAITAGASLSF